MATFTIDRSTFEQLPVLRVEAWVHPHASAPPGKPEGIEHHADAERRPDHVFEPGALTWTPEPAGEGRSLRLRTVFEGERPPFDSPPIPVPESADPAKSNGSTEPIDLSQSIDLGARLFDGHSLPYQTITAVDGAFVDVSGNPKSFRLTKATPFFIVYAGEDYPTGEPIDFTLDYRLTDGNYRSPKLSADSILIPVADPLVRKTVTFEAVGLAQEGQAGTGRPAQPAETSDAAGPVQVVQLTVGHLEDGVGWRIEGESGTTTLSSTQPSHSFTFDAIDPARALTRYQGITVFTNGNQERIPETLVPEATIGIGDAPLWWTVEVDPGLVDWHTYALVVVELRSVHAVEPSEALQFFWRGVPSRYWSFQVPLGRSGTFVWQARYVRLDGSFGWTAEATETSHQAVLPARLPPSTDRTNTRTGTGAPDHETVQAKAPSEGDPGRGTR